ncbi:hypothetical protein GH714_002095 [Hevea brasiliensis]|uniref:BAG domain-containing protein n=1 Tax=Hevea brasiliensis TaxID=3981 RepID=A0A6A6LCC4_HEVBR|nr:hypothetical protein GH714_002095 [Hevea brasiliensis]
MKMEKMKSKMKWVFRPANKSTLNGRGNVNVEDLEIRPGGSLVQKRNSDSNQNSVPIPSIKVKALEATASRGEKVAELDLDNLTGMLMNILVSLDGISAEGDLKFQKGMQERRVQKYIETLDMLKLRNSINNRTEDKIPKQQEENSTGKKPIPMQKLVQQQI